MNQSLSARAPSRRWKNVLGAVAQGLLLTAAVLMTARRAEAACTEGQSRSCTTEEGGAGTQLCDGFSWGECEPIASPPPPGYSPIGTIDVVSLDSAASNVTVHGWALDQDTLQSPIQVLVTVDGHSQGWFPANQYRPDVGSAYPGAGDYHGFSLVIAAEDWGRHLVCVTAINAGGGFSRSLGCRDYFIEGKVTHTWGLPDVTRCVEDPIQAINTLPTTGPDFGFVTSTTSEGLSYTPDSPHLQGITRLAFGDGQHLVVSRSGSWQFYGVSMSDRDTSGGPFGSGLSSSDFVEVRMSNDPASGFDHAGGIQSLGTLLAVPNENRDTDDLNLPIEALTQIRFFDMSTPSCPAPLGILGRDVLESREAGAVALARLGNDRIVMAVGRTESSILDLYVSGGATPDGWSHRDTWWQSEAQTTLSDGDKSFGDYQGLSFVTRCGDGALFLVGTHQSGDWIFGEDWVDLFRLERVGETVVVTKVARRHIDCGQQCSLDASGGAYVAPSGRLIVYATEHTAAGPMIGELHSVKAREF